MQSKWVKYLFHAQRPSGYFALQTPTASPLHCKNSPECSSKQRIKSCPAAHCMNHGEHCVTFPVPTIPPPPYHLFCLYCLIMLIYVQTEPSAHHLHHWWKMFWNPLVMWIPTHHLTLSFATSIYVKCCLLNRRGFKHRHHSQKVRYSAVRWHFRMHLIMTFTIWPSLNL